MTQFDWDKVAREMGFEERESEPWRGRCACRETNQRNNRGLRNCDHGSTPSSSSSSSIILPTLTHTHKWKYELSNTTSDSFLFDLGYPASINLGDAHNLPHHPKRHRIPPVFYFSLSSLFFLFLFFIFWDNVDLFFSVEDNVDCWINDKLTHNLMEFWCSAGPMKQ